MQREELFGTEFPWAQGDITIDGKASKKVGVRYAGDSTYFSSAQGLNRPLKIQFDKFSDQQFNGLSSLQQLADLLAYLQSLK